MTEFQIVWIVMAGMGHLVTMGVVLLSNARQSGRMEEKVRGLSRALDTHREENQMDHNRYDTALTRLAGSGLRGGK